MLAVIMALAMVFTGAAVVMSDSGVDAASWNMDGDIKANQPIHADTDAVAVGPFNVTNNATLTIESGASFTINEGVTVTIAKGSSLVVAAGASVIVDGTLVIENGATLVNNATGTSGFVLNGTLNVAKGGTITAKTTPEASGVKAPSDYNTSELDFAAVGSYDQAGGASAGTTPTVSNNSNVVSVSGGDMTYHMNAVGTYGYWVGVKITGTGITADNTYTIKIDGVNNKDVADSENALYIWSTAGKIRDVTITGPGIDQPYKFIIDTCEVTLAGGSPAGQIILGEKAQLNLNSTKSTPSYIDGQIFSLKNGATLNLDSAIGTCEEDGTFEAGSIVVETITGSNIINASVKVSTTATEATLTKLSFGTESEKAGTVWTGDSYGTKSTKYSYSILTVSGDVGDGYTLAVNSTLNKIAQTDDAENKTASGIYTYGIVKVASGQELTVGEGATFTTVANSVLNIDGKLTINGKENTTADTTLIANATLAGIMDVSGTMEIGDITGSGSTLAGKVNLAELTSSIINIIGNGKATITNGTLDTITDANVSGVYYMIEPTSGDDTLVITSLANAVADEAAEELTISGYEAVSEKAPETIYIVDTDVTVSGKTVTVDYKMKIAEGATLTIDETAEFTDPADTSAKTVIDVDGILIDYSMYDFLSNTEAAGFIADADVRAIDADETYYKYTSLRTALGTAVAGDVIELFGNAEVTGTLTIPADVTLKSDDKTLTVKNDSEVIVNGVLDLVLDVDDGAVSGKVVLTPEASFKKAGKLTVNNMVVGAEGQITDAATSGETVYVAGFYVTGATIGAYENQDMVLAPAVAAANAADIDAPTVNAETSYSGDLTFDAEDDTDVIYVKAKLTVGSITIAGDSIEIDGKGIFTGTVNSANGSMDLKSIAATTSATIIIADVIDTDAGTDILSISGTPVKIDKDGNMDTSASASTGGTTDSGTSDSTDSGTSSTTTPGSTNNEGENAGSSTPATVTIADKDNVAGVTVISGTVYVAASEILDVANLKTFAVSSGATLEIRGTVNFTSLTIDGTVYVAGNGVLAESSDGYIEVLGTLNVKVATADDGTSGTLTVTDVYVGITKKETDKSLAADATVVADSSANITGVVYVVNGASVSEDVVKDKDSTEFYIEDTLWMTAYDMGGSTATASKAPVENAVFNGWNDADGKAIYKSGSTTEFATEIIIADHDRVYADVRYDIYAVVVTADNGVGMVYIDGQSMTKYSNLFYMVDLSAGQHVITWELKNGYTGSVTMTVDGTVTTNTTLSFEGNELEALPGLLEGVGSDDDYVVYEINLSGAVPGTAPSGSSDDGMGLTDYLLIILVVLIVVMAVMVALRMMRS